MITTTLSWIAQQVSGRLDGDDCQISGVSTDTRTLQPNDLFIALTGPNFNGHRFVDKAIELGARAVIASEPVSAAVPVIYVDNTKQALGQLGGAVRASLPLKTVAITGSSGKTTVKEMTSAILSRRGNVLATAGNFNNDIGVPLTLLRLTPEHDFAVLELGANHLGEIAYTTALAKPDVATIVNAAASHLEGFGSLLGVARAKSEIFKGLGDKGVAIINVDSQFAEFWLGKIKNKQVLTFAPDQKNEADFYAEDISLGLDGCAEFQMVTPQGVAAVQLTVPGLHNVGNALLAAALSMQVGASLEDVSEGLRLMQQVKGRLNVKTLSSQVRLLDDTYNANVASVNAAIDTLATFSGLKVLVLGDMAELGEKARYYHEQVGHYAQHKGIDHVFSLGVLSQHASGVYGPLGAHYNNIDDLLAGIEANCLSEQRNISILVKGSRSSKMEKVVAAIEASPLGKLDRRRERIAC